MKIKDLIKYKIDIDTYSGHIVFNFCENDWISFHLSKYSKRTNIIFYGRFSSQVMIHDSMHLWKEVNSKNFLEDIYR